MNFQSPSIHPPTIAASGPSGCETSTIPAPAAASGAGTLQMAFDWEIGHAKPWLFVREIASALNVSEDHVPNLFEFGANGGIDVVIDIKATGAARPAYRVLRESFRRYTDGQSSYGSTESRPTDLEGALEPYLRNLPAAMSSFHVARHLRCSEDLKGSVLGMEYFCILRCSFSLICSSADFICFKIISASVHQAHKYLIPRTDPFTFISVMPRKLRIEYPGAIYHVMNRGDRREDIFRDDDDRNRFLQSLGEACGKTDWRVLAYCLMPNHFHLVIQTPKVNLVAGMKWLLGVYTKRFNIRHKWCGHLFAGRYKALLVDGSGDGYLNTVCDYVHLNPVRAKLLRSDEPLETFKWSSYGQYGKSAKERWPWLRVEPLLGEKGIAKDNRAGRAECVRQMEQRRLEEGAADYGAVRRGWCLGREEFREDMLAAEADNVGANHYGADRFETSQEKARRIMVQRYESWFGVGFEFLLYDVTSTFFEGQVLGNPQAARGYSRDNRPDCKQVCLGLVVSPEGLPLAYEVFSGNRADVTTVEDIVRIMEEKYGKAKRIWVMDRGMVSEENIAFLRQRNAQYIVGTPKAKLRQYESALLEEKDWKQVREGVEVKLLPHPDGKGQEQFVLCRSQARREKEKAMLARQEERLWQKLLQIHQSLQKKPAPAEQIERRVGKWLGRYPAADKLFEVVVELNEQKQACALNAACLVDRKQWAHQAHGAYLLRTNCAEQDPAKVWEWYLQLQQAEAAFRCAKSNLSLRPIFHHKTARVQAHILVCFLSLAMWRTLEMWMKGKGLGTCARQLVGEITTLKSLDVILPVKVGQSVNELRLRTVARPERMVAELLQRLGLHLPDQSRIVQNAVQM